MQVKRGECAMGQTATKHRPWGTTPRERGEGALLVHFSLCPTRLVQCRPFSFVIVYSIMNDIVADYICTVRGSRQPPLSWQVCTVVVYTLHGLKGRRIDQHMLPFDASCMQLRGKTMQKQQHWWA